FSPLHSDLLELVDKLGDKYGSAATEVGQVYETGADDNESAIAQCLGSDCTQVAKLPFDQFKSVGKGKLHNKLIKLIEPSNPVYAQAGDETFSPSPNESGYFQYCLLIKQDKTAGKNLLLAFPCAMS